MDGAPTFDTPALVGPNAVVQLVNALQDAFGPTKARSYFEQLGYEQLFDDPPEAMIDQNIAALLLRALWEALPPEMASSIAGQAGLRTADYILAHRIPKAAQFALQIAPPRISANLLLTAIRKHAWTFSGSGVCETARKPVHLISIRANPLAMPECAWHVAVFDRLFSTLVSRAATVRHVACCRDGEASCRFEIELSKRQREPR